MLQNKDRVIEMRIKKKTQLKKKRLVLLKQEASREKKKKELIKFQINENQCYLICKINLLKSLKLPQK